MFTLCFAVACGGSSSSGGGGAAASSSSGMAGDGSPPGFEGMLAAHNAVRHNAMPPPNPPLQDVTWDADSAHVAQDWASTLAQQCTGLSHNMNRGNRGENIAWFTDVTVTPQGVVDAWSSEASEYDYATNHCSGTCGHYTQLVWRDSVMVGCGSAVCRMGAYAGKFWVCDYSPPGNYVGMRPY